MNTQICFGTVAHDRLGKIRNGFTYPVFFMHLPLTQLPDLNPVLFGMNKHRPLSVHFRDYGSRDGSHPLPWIQDLLQRQGIAADGEIILQTFPRTFGHAFNPVNFWFCHDREGNLRAVLCEVNNTFGEHHHYLVSRPDGAPITADDRLRSDKNFHVSPFLQIKGYYEFHFESDPQRTRIDILYWEEGECRLRTYIEGRTYAANIFSLLYALARYPLLSVTIIARIHWQALRLWFKGASFFQHPLASGVKK